MIKIIKLFMDVKGFVKEHSVISAYVLGASSANEYTISALSWGLDKVF